MVIPIENNQKYLNSNREYFEYFNDEMLEEKPYTEAVKNGYILPLKLTEPCKGGVLTSDFNVVELSLVENDGSYIRIDGTYAFDDDEIDYSNSSEKVLYLGYFFKHWGHFLTDSLDRFWILLEGEYDDYKVVFPPHPGSVLNGNYRRFLELLGVDEDRLVEISKPTFFEKIIVPSPTRIQDGRRHSRYFEDVFDAVVNNAKFSNKCVPQKVFFSRGGLGKIEFGEDELESNFAKNGYKVIYPERLSLDEQIEILQNAQEVVSQNSSICLNVVFARKGLNWIVLNKYTPVHINFTELRYSKYLNVTYIDAFSDRLNFYGHKIGTVPYLMGFNDNLKLYFDDNGMTYATSSFSHRLVNIAKYISCCIVQKPKALTRTIFERTVKILIRLMPKTYERYKSICK